MPSYELQIAVSDAAGAIVTNGVRLFVNDSNDAPSVTYVTASVSENAALGSTLGHPPSVIDQDADTVTFSIRSDSPSGSTFGIDASTGALTVAAALDFETTASYTVSVDATDGTNTTTATVNVNVVDVNDAPVAQVASFTVYENATHGTALGSVQFTDEDSGQTHTFTTSALEGYSGDHSLFAFADSTSPVLSVAGILDFESRTSPYRFSTLCRTAAPGSSLPRST